MILKINKSSVTKNPNADETVSYIPGRTTYHRVVVKDKREYRYMNDVLVLESDTEKPDEERTWIDFSVNTLYHFPEPKYLYDYEHVQCYNCKKSFSHKELEYDEGYDYELITNICPYCKISYCCYYELEQFNEEIHCMIGESNE